MLFEYFNIEILTAQFLKKFSRNVRFSLKQGIKKGGRGVGGGLMPVFFFFYCLQYKADYLYFKVGLTPRKHLIQWKPFKNYE